MTNFLYPITQNQVNIQPAFRIKQFVVKNPTPFPIYINYSGFIPTRDKFDFMAQPYSTVVSPPIDVDLLTVVPAGLELNKFVANINVIDFVEIDPTNVPQFTSQFVQIQGYPFVATNTSIPPPSFTVDKFQNLFFTMSRADSANFQPMILSINGQEIGVFSQQGGVISFVPPAIPFIVNPSLRCESLSGNPYTVNCFQTTDIIDYAFVTPPTVGTVNALSTMNLFVAGSSPGIIWSLIFFPNDVTPDPFPYDISLRVRRREVVIGSAFFTIFQGRFTGTLSITGDNMPLVVPARLMLLADYNILQFEFINNHATEGLNIRVLSSQLE